MTGNASSDTERENPFADRGTNDVERVTCQHEDGCKAPANLWATWPEDRELAEDGTPVCDTHADELDRSDEPVLFTTMTGSERYVLTDTDRSVSQSENSTRSEGGDDS
ncbi:hypothetical protein SAMN05216285_2266 [Natrinema salifodinae]|uniref:Uncharacterized protein n=1 Tax=Natrinema salifodinae TaxID=1202768 RepID=A0A1I0P8E8_9EURY|nr:hypothetical protein SAMN05216285_2266 [Natrinema salifodinae]